MAKMKDVVEYADADEDPEEQKEKPERKIVRNAVDLQRIKLEKLMKNPDKPIIIPEIPKEKEFVYSVPTFVRNVMGSSAGAGSGEFHVYRNLRRKEYARQKIIEVKSHKEQLNQEYREKLERNRQEAEAKTAKKRAKRLKKKKQKNCKRNKKENGKEIQKYSDSESDSDRASNDESENIQKDSESDNNKIEENLNNISTEKVEQVEESESEKQEDKANEDSITKV